MLIVHVSIQVKEEYIQAFREATMDNVKNSMQEEGVYRFEAFQVEGAPSNFLMVEMYYTPEDQLKHRETEHFKAWKAKTAEMLTEPYTFTKYEFVYPVHSGRE
jgi:(4S)-4-hydroxy-5-phosphonooxypentane-2,3-dione isomerase